MSPTEHVVEGMGWPQFVDDLLRHPPAWILTVIATIIAAHAVHRIALPFISSRHKGPNGLIIIIELFIVILLGYLTLHRYVCAESSGGVALRWYDQPLLLLLLLLLLLFALLSMILYLLLLAKRPRSSRHSQQTYADAAGR